MAVAYRRRSGGGMAFFGITTLGPPNIFELYRCAPIRRYWREPAALSRERGGPQRAAKNDPACVPPGERGVAWLRLQTAHVGDARPASPVLRSETRDCECCAGTTKSRQ